jgi:hypothetical protein
MYLARLTSPSWGIFIRMSILPTRGAEEDEKEEEEEDDEAAAAWCPPSSSFSSL